MWFVDVHSYKLPSPSGIFMEHLWHRGSTHTFTHTQANKKKLQVIQSTGKNTHKCFWLNYQEASVTTKKALSIKHKSMSTQTEIHRLDVVFMSEGLRLENRN